MFVLSAGGCLLSNVLCHNCTVETALSGTIKDSAVGYNKYEKCWIIPVPSGSFVRLQINSIVSQALCPDAHVNISVGNIEEYRFCSPNSSRHSVTALSDVTIIHHAYKSGYYYSSNFELKYDIKYIECVRKDSFQCDSNFCIPISKVCDGVEDCENGADEAKCKTKVLSIEGIEKARVKAIAWLKRNETTLWNWQDDTTRAVVALYLASDAFYNGTDLKEELMAKEVELKTAIALLRSSFSDSELSMLINALLVICRDPRHFYGKDLVKLLKDRMEQSTNFTHPLTYLALCNANESWPMKANTDLNSILKNDSEYPFIKDLQAMATMAFSCRINQSKKSDIPLNLTLYRNTIKHFQERQLPDGSFGTVHTTALITQALLASGEEQTENWKRNATMKYLMKEMNSSSIDILTTYLTLPIFNAKSLADISKTNCSSNPRKREEDVSENKDEKMRVQYSLYIGDKKNVVHTISIKVPENYTAFEVMELAASKDPKYKFDQKIVSGKMYVYKIADIVNDPEIGKFWLLYTGAANDTESLMHSYKSPDKLILSDEEHLVMWYRTAII
ncbi:uncharacterized protein CG3556 [Trichonephila inaurata madagascariensis]|uniref:Uncharacterized protein CG3556 n=1 Tax=Trichonephila inaurata madagascariensis TaxID=2747483 RepID=A0A8X6X2C6_9ARAC|nr:uncharacterized protein CG3556 [Trichonephila inaurata madagascariensis]